MWMLLLSKPQEWISAKILLTSARASQIAPIGSNIYTECTKFVERSYILSSGKVEVLHRSLKRIYDPSLVTDLLKDYKGLKDGVEVI
jgi:hypothetical protein